MENLSDQINKKAAFDAKLHGFKMQAPAKIQKWSAKDNERVEKAAQEAYRRLEKEAAEKANM